MALSIKLSFQKVYYMLCVFKVLRYSFESSHQKAQHRLMYSDVNIRQQNNKKFLVSSTRITTIKQILHEIQITLYRRMMEWCYVDNAKSRHLFWTSNNQKKIDLFKFFLLKFHKLSKSKLNMNWQVKYVGLLLHSAVEKLIFS